MGAALDADNPATWLETALEGQQELVLLQFLKNLPLPQLRLLQPPLPLIWIFSKVS